MTKRIQIAAVLSIAAIPAKGAIFAFAMLAVLIAPAAEADYVNPLGWSEYALGKEGVWTMEEGWAQVEGIIPNEENEDLSEEIWIQATLHTNIRGQVPIDILFEFPDGAYTVTEMESSTNPAGDGWFYHTSLFDLIEGTYLLAKSVFSEVEKVLPERIRRVGCGEGTASEADCAERLAFTDWDRYRSADEVLFGLIQKPPFTNQLLLSGSFLVTQLALERGNLFLKLVNNFSS